MASFGSALSIYALQQLAAVAVRPLPLQLFLLTVFDVFVGVFACELMLWGLFALTLTRRHTRVQVSSQNGSDRWWGIIGYFRSFLLISSLTVGTLAIWLPIGSLVWLAVVVAITWWWFALGAAICALAKPGIGRTIAILAIPAVAYVSIVIGMFASLPMLILLPDALDFLGPF